MKTCFFIGHRNAPSIVFSRLEESVVHHIKDYDVKTFVVGRYGSFDHMAMRAVTKAKRNCPEIQLLALIPYYRPFKKMNLPQDFDGSLYPEGMEKVPKYAAIVRANQYMIKHSDYLIAFDCGHVGNTRPFMEYARKREAKGLLHIENLAEYEIRKE